jgi:beta-lactamase superfamily II metal-dependent hydrolase
MEKKVEIYQFAPLSGMLMEGYLIKTPNDKIVVIDGGSGETYLEKAFMPSAIRAILGLKENEYFEIEAWFLSHAHSDHYGEMIMMFREYNERSNYKVNNIYFDFPDMASSKFDPSDYSLEGLEILQAGMDNYAKVNGIACVPGYYHCLNGKVVNADAVANGLTITIDGVDFEILQTQSPEDDQVNGNSMVIRVVPSYENAKTCMFLNDTSVWSGAKLLKTYGAKLKSDVVQMAHHGQAGADKDVYEAIGAKLRLWPVPFWVWENETDYKIGQVRSWFGIDENVGRETDLVSCKYGKYPEDYTSIDSWKQCLDVMKIVL